MPKSTRRNLYPGAALTILVAVGCGTRGETMPAPGAARVEMERERWIQDAGITAAIQGQFFMSDVVKTARVDVDVNQGLVTLRGTVSSGAAHEEALRLARAVRDVTSVQDELMVEKTTMGRRSDRVDAGGNKERDPNWITTQIQAQYYLHAELKPWKIDVTTSRDGLVTLSGRLDQEADRAKAIRVARKTRGVSEIRDLLQVIDSVATSDAAGHSGRTGEKDEAREAITDARITAKIQSKYFLDPNMKGLDIDVHTHADVVALRGTVDSPGQRLQAVSMAANTDGVRGVRDELRVEPPFGRNLTDQRRHMSRQPVDDLSITVRLQSKFFKEDEMQGSRVDVRTTNGTVTLSGTVPSDPARRAAEALARDTHGVEDVVNHLNVNAVPHARLQ